MSVTSTHVFLQPPLLKLPIPIFTSLAIFFLSPKPLISAFTWARLKFRTASHQTYSFPFYDYFTPITPPPGRTRHASSRAHAPNPCSSLPRARPASSPRQRQPKNNHHPYPAAPQPPLPSAPHQAPPPPPPLSIAASHHRKALIRIVARTLGDHVFPLWTLRQRNDVGRSLLSRWIPSLSSSPSKIKTTTTKTTTGITKIPVESEHKHPHRNPKPFSKPHEPSISRHSNHRHCCTQTDLLLSRALRFTESWLDIFVRPTLAFLG